MEKLVIETNCSKCIFAVHAFEDGKDRQIDCYIKRHELLEASGGTIFTDETDDLEFFVIQDRVCPYHRTDDWMEIQDPDVELNLNDLADVAREEIRISFAVVLICAFEDIKHIVDTIESFAGSTLRPTEFIVAIPASRDDFVKIIETLKFNFDKSIVPCKWTLHKVEDTCDPYVFVHKKLQKSKCRYFCFARGGDNVDKHYLANIDILINEASERISTVIPDGPCQPTVCQRELFFQLKKPDDASDFTPDENPVSYLTRHTLNSIGLQELARTTGQICPPELSVS